MSFKGVKALAFGADLVNEQIFAFIGGRYKAEAFGCIEPLYSSLLSLLFPHSCKGPADPSPRTTEKAYGASSADGTRPQGNTENCLRG